VEAVGIGDISQGGAIPALTNRVRPTALNMPLVADFENQALSIQVTKGKSLIASIIRGFTQVDRIIREVNRHFKAAVFVKAIVDIHSDCKQQVCCSQHF
jgi:hypothetical protein